MNHLHEARVKLSANNIESGLPGREMQNDEIYNFIYERLKIRQTTEAKKARVESGQVAKIQGRHMNKTMFICGVPGTGKTVTVHSVIHRLDKLLKEKPSPIHKFKYIYVNGQHLASPERLYSEILYRLTDENCPPDKAQDELNKLFLHDQNKVFDETLKTTRRNKTRAKKDVSENYKIICVDELDLLYRETKQNVFYSLFDWPTTTDSKLILIVIANAMDLSERCMRGRIASRLGWNKLIFDSYTSDCLETILRVRLGPQLLNKCFQKSAVKIATVRIGRTTGDARRVLDTCRLAIDKAIASKQSQVTPEIIDTVGFQNLDLQRRSFVTSCTAYELFTLKAILKQSLKVGDENVAGWGVYKELNHMLTQHASFRDQVIGFSQFGEVLTNLAGVGMIYLEHDKPLPRKRMFIKDSSDVFNDIIQNQKIEV